MSDGFLARWSRRKAGGPEGGAAQAAEPLRPAEASPSEAAQQQAGSPGAGSRQAAASATGRATAASPAAATATATAATATTATATASVEAKPPEPPLPTLADVALLTLESDYSRFVLPAVEPEVKNAALRKLFTDPHYNVMDGLDTYIDDYGKPDPMPPSMLRALNQSAVLGLFDEDDSERRAEGDSDRNADVGTERDGRHGNTAPAADSPHGEPPAGVAQSSASGPDPLSTPRRDNAASAPHDDDADLRLQQDDAPRRSGSGPGAGP